jgi:hypothetical protein
VVDSAAGTVAVIEIVRGQKFHASAARITIAKITIQGAQGRRREDGDVPRSKLGLLK